MSAPRVVSSTPTSVCVEVRVPGADAAAAYAVISDVGRMRELSPEGRARATTPGPLEVGGTFAGGNRRGRRRWSTTCTVVHAEAPLRFAFDVAVGGMPVARWDYAFEDSADGVTVRETWTDHRHGLRGLAVKVAGLAASGVWNRAEHNAGTMKGTLAALSATLTS